MENVSITPGSGNVVAADDIGGIKFQRIKLVLGNDGVNDGDVSATNPVPVIGNTTIISLPALPAGGNTIGTVNIGTIGSIATETSLAGLNAKIPAALTGGGGLKVGLVDALPTGTNAIGKLAANSGVNIGTVDIGSLPGITGTVTANIGTISGIATETTLAAINTKIPASPAQEHTGAASFHSSRLTDGTSFYKATTPSDTQPVSGTVTANIGTIGSLATEATIALVLAAISSFTHVEDSAHVSGHSGILSLAVRNDAGTALAADGDYLPFTTDSTGALRVTGGSGGTQYAEDTAHVSADMMTMAGVVQQSADSALSGDGDRSLLQVDASGFLKVNIKAGAGSGGTALGDKASFVEGTTSFTPIGGVFNETIGADPTEDQAAAFRITAKRAMHVNLRDASGAEITSFGGGTEYTEGATDATITGTAILWEDTSDTLRAVSAAKPLPIGGSVGLLAGSNNIGDVDVLTYPGPLAAQLPAALVSARLDVNLGAAPASLTIGTLPSIPAGSNKIGAVDLDSDAATGSAVPAVAQFVAGTDGTNARGLKTDAAGELQIDVLTLPSVTIGSLPAVTQGTSPWVIGDGAGSITVDAPVGTPVNVQIGDGTLTASIRNTGASDSLNVAIVDASGNHVTSFGGSGTQYTEGDADASITGTALLWEAGSDTLSTVSAASPLPVGGTVTANLGTIAGVATETTLSAINGKLPAALISGRLDVNIGAAPASLTIGTLPSIPAGSNKIGAVDLDSDAATGSTVPAVAQFVAGTDGTNARGLKTDASGELQIDVLTLPAVTQGTSPWVIGDGAGSITVDAPVGTPVNVQIGDGTLQASIRNTGASDSLNVAIVDGSGNQITSFGSGGVQYTEGDTDSTITGTAMLWEDGSDTLRAVSAAKPLPVAGIGTFTVGATDLDIRNLVFATDKVDVSGSTLGANSGVDVGDVTINNGAGAGAVNIQDGGNSLTIDNATFSVIGGGVEAAALRVTIASDSTGVLSVDDNGGSITVDGSVSVSGAVDTELPAAAALADNTANPTVPGVGSFLMGFDGTNWDRIRADGGSVFIQDGGNSITIDGSVTVSGTVTANIGTSGSLALDATLAKLTIAQGAALGANTQALIGGSVTTAAPTYTTGQISPLSLTTAGLLRVDGSGATQPISGTVTANAGTNLNTSLLALESGGNLAAIAASASVLDDWDESDRAKVNPIAGQAGVQGASGAVTALTQRVVLATDIGLPTGTNTLGSIASITTSIVPGSGALNLGKAEDSVAASGDVGVAVWGVRNDAGTAFAADGDYVPLSIDSSGALRITGGGGGTQYTEGDTDATITGTAMLWEDTSDTLRAVSAAKPLPVAGIGTFTVVATDLDIRNLLFATDKVDISGSTLAANSGVDIGDVTINNASGASAVNIQDGGNSITVDGAVTVSGTVTANIGTSGSLALDATLAKLTIAQGAALGTNTQALIGGSVTTAAPSYTTGQISPLSLTTAGLLRVDGSGVTQPISGTVTANAGTGTFTVSGTVTANIGTSGSLALEAGGNLAAIAASASVLDDWDESDRAKVNPIAGQAGVQGASGVVTALTQRVVLATDIGLPAGSSTIGSIASITTSIVPGTGATNLGKAEDSVHSSGDVGVAVWGVRSDAGTAFAADGDYVPLSIDSSGALRVTGGGGGTEYTEGATDATITGAAILWEDTSDTLRAVSAAKPLPIGDAGGSLTVDGTVTANAGTGTFTVGGTVTANIGTSGSLALDATLAKLTIAQGTALGSNTQALIGGSVTTAAPTYTTGQISPLSLTTGGLLRVDGSGVTQPVSGTVTANAGTGTFTVGGTVTANIGTSGSLALDATLAKLTVAQGAALGSNTQALIGGSVTTAAPTYTTGQISPLSLSTAGLLRVDGSGATQPVSGTVTVTQGTGTNLHSVVDSGTITTVSTVTNLSQLGGTAISMNTGVRDAGTQRVTIATNDVVPSSQSGTWNITNLSGTVSLPTGASTLAEQQTQTTSLQLIDDAVYATNGAISKSIAIGGQLDDTGTTAATENNVASVRITAQRAFHTNLRDNAGAEIGTSGAPLRIDPTGSTTQPISGTVSANLNAGSNNIGDVDVLTLPAIPTGANTIGSIASITTSIVPGTGATNLGKAEDAVHASGDVGVAVWGVRNDAGTAFAADGDYVPFSIDSAGALRVTGGGGGTQYTEADIDASITGTAMLWEDTSDTLRAVSAAKPLPVAGIGTFTVSGTVTANIGTSGSLALDATLAKLTITQGTALGSNTVALMGGSVTTTVPSYTAGQISPLSLNPSGALRVDASSASVNIGSISGAMTPGSGALNLGKAEDAAHTTGDVGVMALAVRNDAGTALAGTTGDYIPLSTDSTGALRVTGGGGGTQYAEDLAHISGDLGTMALAVRSDAGTAFGADGDYVPLSIDSEGALRVTGGGGGTQYVEGDTDATITGSAFLWEDTSDTLRAVSAAKPLPIGDAGGSLTIDNSTLSVLGGGTEATALRVTIANDSTGLVSIDDGAGSLTVDGTVAATQSGTWNIGTVTPGTAATNLGKSEDLQHASGDTGVAVWGVRNDSTAQTSLTSTDGDYSPIATDIKGNSLVVGNVPHDAVDAGNPVKVGYKAIAHGTNPTAVAAADRTDAYANRAGIPFVMGGHPNLKTAVYNTTAANTDDNVLAAISSGTKYVITRITIMLDEATTVGVGVRLGFGTSTIPALGASSADAVDEIIAYHPGLVPGSGFQVGDGSGIIGIGGDGAELRITNEVPTSGTLSVSVNYYTIES